MLHLGLLCERDAGLHLSGVRVEHIAKTAGYAAYFLTIDEMADDAHCAPPGLFGPFPAVWPLPLGFRRRRSVPSVRAWSAASTVTIQASALPSVHSADGQTREARSACLCPIPRQVSRRMHRRPPW